jgi:hypothetical protein
MKMGKSSRRRPSTLRSVGTLVLLNYAGVTAAQQPDTTTDASKGLKIRSNKSSLGLSKAEDLAVPRNDAIDAFEQQDSVTTTESFEALESDDGRQVGFLLGKRLCLFLICSNLMKHY